MQMSIKVVDRIYVNESPLVITTHGGDFDLDDVISMSIFCMTSHKDKIIVRNDDEKWASGIMIDEIIQNEKKKCKNNISKTEAVWRIYGERIVKRILKMYKESPPLTESDGRVKELADIVYQKSFSKISKTLDDPNYLPGEYSYFDLFIAEGTNDLDSVFQRLLDYTACYVLPELVIETALENIHRV